MSKIQTNLSVCLSDIHYPFRDSTAVDMVVKFIREQQPGRIHLLGDLCDCWV